LQGIQLGLTQICKVALDMLADRAYNLLFKEGLSKKDEFQSDAQGAILTATLGYDWKSYRDFIGNLKHLMNAGYGETVSKTHPSIAERVIHIEDTATENGFYDEVGKKNIERFEEYVQLTGSTLKADFSDLDVRKEISIGRQLAAKILGKYSLLDNKELQKYISLLGTGISAQMGRSELGYYFAVLDTDDVGSFACPGGYVFITRGAVQMMSNEAQLVGLLSHEIVNINQKHLVNMLKARQKNGADASVRIPLEHISDKGFMILMENGLDEALVLNSDVTVIEILSTTGYDVQSYQIFLNELNRLSKDSEGVQMIKYSASPALRFDKIKETIFQKGLQKYEGKTNKDRFKKQTRF